MSQYKLFACIWWHIVVNNFSGINVLHIFCTAASASNTLSHSSMYSWMSLYFTLEAWDNIGLEKTISRFSTVLYTHIQRQCYLQQLETRWQDLLSIILIVKEANLMHIVFNYTQYCCQQSYDISTQQWSNRILHTVEIPKNIMRS